ncbi:MAG TPA: FkbM family methyltransferase [Candidatus Dormibacteraeota bacterium]|nr:FkbM family methyltransferase [Candidatus Dormibacteraeota bacterium]
MTQPTRLLSPKALRIAVSDPRRAVRKIRHEIHKFLEPSNIRNLRRMLALRIRNAALRNKPIAANVAGHTLCLVPQGAVAEILFSGEAYEIAELAFISRFLRPHSVFLDVGANVGIFSLSASKAFPSCTIVAFEPTTTTFHRLSQNISLNHASNVQPFRLALSNSSGTATLNLNSSSRDGLNTLGHPSHPDFAPAGTELVPIITLDEFLASHRLPRVDLMKVDAEGAELFIFQGAEELLRRPDAPLILYEAVPANTRAFDYHPVEIFWLLDRWGFSFFTLDSQTGKLAVPPASRAYGAMIVAVKRSHPAYSAIEALLP